VRFFRTPSVLPLLYPSLLWKIDTLAKDIYITFDDGPVAGPTDFVVDTLKSFNAKATFFCIGDNIRKHPDQFRRVTSTHAVGNHTFNHLNGWKTSAENYLKNIQLCQQQLLPSNKLFRPPFGRIKRSQVSLLRDYRIVMWDVLTFDYDRSLSSDKCLNGSIKAVRPGSIIVFHDSLKAEKNLNYVLPRFMEHCASQGYTFKSL